jgi:hypothetical protein
VTYSAIQYAFVYHPLFEFSRRGGRGESVNQAL